MPQPIPGRWLYAVPALVLCAGIAGFVLFLVSAVGGMGEDLHRVQMPGRAPLSFAEPGAYTLFHEHRTYTDGRIYESNAPLSGFGCTLWRDGEAVPGAVAPATMNETYAVGGRAGRALFVLRVPQAGAYELDCASPPPVVSPPVTLAIGGNVVWGIVGTVMWSMALLLGAIAVAVALTVVIAIRRERGAKAASQPAGGST
jgi:hypothetical protein